MQFVWAAVIIAAIVIEALTAELISIWFLPAGLISLIISFFQPKAIGLQVLVFILVSFVFIVLSRTIFKKYFESKITPTNLDAVIGETAVVVEEISNTEETGAVKIQGKVWSARSENGEVIEKDATVSIVEIKGVKLICKKN